MNRLALGLAAVAAAVAARAADPGPTPTPGRTAIPSNLVERLALYFPFDQAGDRVADASGRGHHGVSRGAVWIPDGHTGGAMRFNGASQWLEVPDQPALRPPRFTLAAWVRPDRDLRGPGRRVVISREKRGPAAGYDLGWRDGRVSLTLRADRAAPKTYDSADYNLALSAGAWRFLAATYDGETARLYVDGEPLAAIPLAADWPPESRQDLFIGAQAPGDQGHWAGDLDDLMLFDRALSADEVQSLCRP